MRLVAVEETEASQILSELGLDANLQHLVLKQNAIVLEQKLLGVVDSIVGIVVAAAINVAQDIDQRGVGIVAVAVHVVHVHVVQIHVVHVADVVGGRRAETQEIRIGIGIAVVQFIVVIHHMRSRVLCRDRRGARRRWTL